MARGKGRPRHKTVTVISDHHFTASNTWSTPWGNSMMARKLYRMIKSFKEVR